MSAAPVSTDVRRRAVVGRVARAPGATAPTSGKSHPPKWLVGEAVDRDTRHSASSGITLVVPSHAANAIAFGPAARACGRNSVATAPTGAAKEQQRRPGEGRGEPPGLPP